MSSLEIPTNQARDVLPYCQENHVNDGMQRRFKNNVIARCDLLPVCGHQYMYPTERDARRR